MNSRERYINLQLESQLSNYRTISQVRKCKLSKIALGYKFTKIFFSEFSTVSRAAQEETEIGFIEQQISDRKDMATRLLSH